MGKRVWYYIYVWNEIKQEMQKVAKVRSEGLANLTANCYRKHYKQVEIRGE